MKLKPRTTYLNGDGQRVMIAGLAKCPPVEGETIFYSIQGNWYSETGLYVVTYRDGRRVLCDRESRYNLVREDTSPQAVSWWDGVTTERKS